LGRRPAGKTLSSNLALYQSGIPTHSFSASTRDAIAVTRISGLEYLWVDSLCKTLSIYGRQSHADLVFPLGIVQDDAEELTTEIFKQATIYQNGTVTILAGGARSTDEGFLQRRQKLRHSCCIDIQVHGSGLTKTGLLCEFYHGMKRQIPDPIDSRAWIFQEGKLPLLDFESNLLAKHSSAISNITVFQSRSSHVLLSRRGACRWRTTGIHF
jgi:hypothetical protein